MAKVIRADRFYSVSGLTFYVIMDRDLSKAVAHVNYCDLPEGMTYSKHSQMLIKQMNDDRSLYISEIADYITSTGNE